MNRFDIGNTTISPSNLDNQGSTPPTTPEGKSFLDIPFVRNIVVNNPLVQTAANIQGGATFGQALDKVQTDTANRKQLQIAQEREQGLQKLMTQKGVSKEQAIKLAKYSLTPTEQNDLLNMVLGFTGAEGELKGLIPKLTSAKTVEETTSLLKSANVADDLVKIYAPKFATLTDEKAVQEGVQALQETINTTKKVVSTAEKVSTTDPAEVFIRELDKLPSIKNNVQANNVAGAMTELSGKGGVQGFENELNGQFKQWVNNRAASRVEGLAVKEKFKPLDELGFQGISDFQKIADQTPEFKSLREYFNQKYAQVKDSGIDLNYKNDYLPQLWQNPMDEVQSVLGKRLGLKPSFTLDSVFKTYEEGIQAGLTPKYTKLSELTSWYEQRVNKAIADKEFFDYLANNNFIVPQGKSPIGYKTLDADRFPKLTVRFGEKGTYSGVYSAPPALADVINNYLKTPEGPVANFAKFATLTKNIVLSSGIPKTGINAHGLNILVRNTLASKNPISGFLKGTYYLIAPQQAEKFVKANLDSATFAVKNGLTLSTEEHVFDALPDNIIKKGIGKLVEFQDRLFARPLFQQIIPALKLQYFNTIYKELAISYPEKEAAQKSAEIANNIFGGINLDVLGRSKKMQNVLRSVILAPDWAESNIKTGGGIAKSFFSNTPEAKVYRTFVRNIVMAYTAADVANYSFSGHHLFENEAGHTLEIQISKDSKGKTVYLRPFGTATDFVRLPYDIALSIGKGDLSSITRVVLNRLSTPAKSILDLVTNVDTFGRPILGKDKYGRQIPFLQQVGGVLSQISATTIPQYGDAAIDYLFGRSSAEQATSQALELPFRFSATPKGSKATSSNRFNL